MLKEIILKEISPFARKIVFIDNNLEIGYLDYSLIYDRIEIDNLFVNEKYRNNKIGTKLLSYLVYKAIEENAINITLEVRINNLIAINLYKKFGFREVALRKNYYGNEDGILMEKQVM